MTVFHRFLGVASFLLITGFLVTTLAGELSGDSLRIAATKRYVALSLLILIPCLIATAVLGNRLARGRTGGLPAVKRRRMVVIGANGALILTPSAIALWSFAEAGRFDFTYHALQVVELCAGTLNLGLIALQIRDGMRMHGRAHHLVAGKQRSPT